MIYQKTVDSNRFGALHQVGYQVKFIYTTMLALLCSPSLLALLFWQQPLVLFSFFVPLLTQLLYRKGEVQLPVPPLVVFSLLLILIGLIKQGPTIVGRILYTNRTAVLIIILIFLFEFLSFFINRSATRIDFILGRVGFMVIVFGVAITGNNLETVRRAMIAYVIAVFILGVLTILHAFDIYSLPIAMYRLAPRSFFGIRFPVARTLGIAMSYGKFGIITSFAVAILVLSTFARYKVAPWTAVRIGLLIGVMSGVLISQGRGVYLAVLTTVLIGSMIGIVQRFSISPNANNKKQYWLFIIVVVMLIALASAVFIPGLSEAEIVDVQTARGQDNVESRVTLNHMAASLLQENPWFGVGHGAFTAITDEETGIHNHFLEQFVATGFLGGLAYLAFYAFLLLRAWRLIGSADMRMSTISAIIFVGIAASIIEYQVFPGFLVEATAYIAGLGLFIFYHSTQLDKQLLKQSR